MITTDSIRLDEYRKSPQAITDKLVAEIVKAEEGTRRKRSQADFDGLCSTVSAIVANAVVAHLISSNCTVGIRLRKNYYSSSPRYRNTALTHKAAVAGVEEDGG